MRGIEVKNLSKSFSFYVSTGIFKREKRFKQAVSDLSFSVSEGEIMGLVGANGAGKTTMVKMLAGVMKPDSGTVIVDGEDPFNRSSRFRNNVSIVLGQKGKLHPDMSILESASVYGAMYKLPSNVCKERILAIGSMLSLTEEDLSKQSRSLSLGQRMKGEICLSFINQPKTVFLDEPTLGLDITSTRSIRAFLKQYCAENSAVIILTSHDLGDIVETCSKLLIIDNGGKVFFGPISDLPKSAENDITIRYKFESEATLEEIKSKFPDTLIDGDTAVTVCMSDQIDDTLNQLFSLGTISNLKIEEKPIESIIEDLTYES